MMSNWIYYEHFNPEEYVSFVYLIKINGMEYIGKKNFFTTRKKPFGKKKLAELQDKRLKKYELVKKESNWKNYCSSSEDVKKLVEEGHTPERIILRLCKSLKEASFYENKYLYECIHEETCLNKNVSGTYFKEEILEWQ